MAEFGRRKGVLERNPIYQQEIKIHRMRACDADSKYDKEKLSDQESSNTKYLRRRYKQRHIRECIKSQGTNSGASKRSSGDAMQVSRRTKRRASKKRLDKLLTKQIETSKILMDSIIQHDIPSMRDCLNKLGAIDNLTPAAIMAVHDALVENEKNMVTLMVWDGPMLRAWIEHVVAKHPVYYALPVWL